VFISQFRADDGPSTLSPGIHSFPFKLGLPLGLPSTFLGKHGWVQYYCKAALRESGGLTHKNQQVFIVMNPIDLNLEPPILAVSYVTSTCDTRESFQGRFRFLLDRQMSRQRVPNTGHRPAWKASQISRCEAKCTLKGRGKG